MTEGRGQNLAKGLPEPEYQRVQLDGGPNFLGKSKIQGLNDDGLRAYVTCQHKLKSWRKRNHLACHLDSFHGSLI